MTIEEALQAATLGGAKALKRDDIGRLTPGARADAAVLAAPSYAHLVYRPGVPLVAATICAGRIEWADPWLGSTAPARLAAGADPDRPSRPAP